MTFCLILIVNMAWLNIVLFDVISKWKRLLASKEVILPTN